MLLITHMDVNLIANVHRLIPCIHCIPTRPMYDVFDISG